MQIKFTLQIYCMSVILNSIQMCSVILETIQECGQTDRQTTVSFYFMLIMTEQNCKQCYYHKTYRGVCLEDEA